MDAARDSARTTALLRSVDHGDAAAAEQLLPLVYDELRRLAERMMKGERSDHTLQPTALVHEAFLRLVDQSGSGLNDRLHFMRLAARAMRRLLVDHSRARNADKRGGGRFRATFDEALLGSVDDADHLLAVDGSLHALGELDPQLAQIVELRFFSSLTHEEVAAALGTSLRTVERGWRLARAWLVDDLEKRGCRGH